MSWIFTDDSERVVVRINGDGSMESRTINDAEIAAWIAAGNKPVPALAPSLEELKADKNSEINKWRLQANLSTFSHQGKEFSCDALSRSDIDGMANHIALFNAFPLAFPGIWKTVDNSVIEMPTIEDFKALYQSMTAQGTANFNHAETLRAELFSAETDTPEKIAAIF